MYGEDLFLRTTIAEILPFHICIHIYTVTIIRIRMRICVYVHLYMFHIL